MSNIGFPGGADGKEPACQCRRLKRRRFNPWVKKMPWRRAWPTTPVFLPGKSHGQRSLAGYSPWGRKESDTTEHTFNLWQRRLDTQRGWYEFPGNSLTICIESLKNIHTLWILLLNLFWESHQKCGQYIYACFSISYNNEKLGITLNVWYIRGMVK